MTRKSSGGWKRVFVGGGTGAHVTRTIFGLIALSFAVFQFLHASHLTYKTVGPGTAYNTSFQEYSGRYGNSYHYYVHVHVDQQHRTVNIDQPSRTQLYSAVKASPEESLQVTQVEVDTFDNEISRVEYNGTWLNSAGRQKQSTLIIAGIVALLISLVFLVPNVPYFFGSSRRARRPAPGRRANPTRIS